MSNDRPRIALFASNWLGAEVLRRLAARPLELALVAPSAEDRAARAAQGLGLALTIKPDSVALMATDLPWRPDLAVCAHSFRILPGWFLRWSRQGAIGYHPSLLPAFKGRHAVRDALAAGAAVTGGTVYRLTDQIDGGPPVMGRSTPLQRPVEILSDDTPAGLWRRALAPLGVELLLEAVEVTAAVNLASSRP